ncbi:MAG: hypothetical protein ABIE84_04585 [bacterium]
MKRLLIGLMVLGLLVSVVKAEDIPVASSDQANFESSIGGLDIGYIRVGTAEIINLAWHPDFKFGPWGLGADINASLGEQNPSGYENYVLRYVEYDNGKMGLRYGVIQGLTWGHGLLMEDYSTWVSGSVLLNNEQLAWLGYYSFDDYTIRALSAKTGVYGVRVEEKINPLLTLGQSYITDGDGVLLPGTTRTQTETGIGVDATTPFMGMTGYAEYAMLMNRGGGLDVGLKWAQDFGIAGASFAAGYRMLDAKFVPGYFNSDYEFNPIDLNSVEATGNNKNGYTIKLGLQAVGMAALNIRYENYNESEAAVYGDLYAKLPPDLEVIGYYQQPSFVDFRSLDVTEGAIIGAKVAYPVNAFTKAVIHYKKFYNPTTAQVETTRQVELKFSF